MTRDDNSTVARKALLSIPLILLPAVCLLLALPSFWAIWSGVVSGDVNIFEADSLLLAYAAVVTAAILAVPGYFVAAFEEHRLTAMKSLGRWWIRSSLAAAFVASLVALPLTFFFGRWLWLFPAGTAVACLTLVGRAERIWRPRRLRPFGYSPTTPERKNSSTSSEP